MGVGEFVKGVGDLIFVFLSADFGMGWKKNEM